MFIKIKFILLFLITACLQLFSQNNSLQLGDGIITLSKGAVININQPSADGITRDQGFICSEGETNRIAWITGTSKDVFVFPFGTIEGEHIPVVLDKTTEGINAGTNGSIIVSTYHSFVNNTPYPCNSNGYFSNVDQMNDAAGIDNSLNVVDRFWLLCFHNYWTIPSVTASFAYDGEGPNNDVNGLVESDLKAQYWDGSSWNPTLLGTSDPVNHKVAAIADIHFNAPWTLVNKNAPLPVELISFNANCNNSEVEISWSTAAEVNSDFYTVHKSTDLADWTMVAQINAAGNSNDVISYTVSDESLDGQQWFYRLTQTDIDGSSTFYDPVAVECSTENSLLIIGTENESENILSIGFSGIAGDDFVLSLVDISGRLIEAGTGKIKEGSNTITFYFENQVKGIYMLVLQASAKTVTKKIYL